MSDIRITPAASLLAFSSSLGYIETLTQGASGSIVLYGSGSAGRTNVFAVDGTNGRLFSVDDDLSNSLFSVNTIAGLPVIEAFANNTVNIGKYGAYSFVATGSGDARIGSGSVMFVSASGNVGIGTTTPSSTLHVSSGAGAGNYAAYIQNTGAGNGLKIYNADWDTTDYLLYASNGGSYVTVIDGNGRVGIGTTTPTAKLQVSAGRSYFFSGDNYSVGLAQTAAQGNYMYLGTAADGTFYISETSGTARVTVQQGGNVGINTTSPQKILDVAIGSNDFATVGAMTSMSVGQWAGVHFGYRENNTNYRKSAIVFERTDNSGGGSNASGKVHILNGPAAGAGSATLADAKLTVNEYGAVGIGTTTPSARLSLGSSTNGERITWSDFSNIFSEYSSGELWLSSNFYGNLGSSGYKTSVTATYGAAGISVSGVGAGTDGALKFFVDNAASKTAGDAFTPTERMRITGGGNVGIGTTTPSNKLQVVGGVTATSFTGSLQGSASYATTASYSLNAGSSATFNNNTNNYIMTGTGTTNTLNGESNLQYDGNGLFIGNAGSIPGSPANGTVLYSEDVASSSELKVKDEAGNITTLSPHNFSLIPQGPSEALAWSYYSEKDGKKINVDMLKLARTLEKLTGEKLVYIE